MKLIYTSIILLITSISYSQGIEIYKTGETQDISGTEVIVTALASQTELQQRFDLLNTTGSDLNLKVVRIKLEEMTGGVEDYLTWWNASLLNGFCYPSTSVSTQDLFSSESLSFSPALAIQALEVYYIPNGIAGTTKYRYYILDNDTQIRRDSVDVTFNTSTLSTKEQQQIDFLVFPNPVNTILNISISENNTTISIFDITGKNVSEMELNNGINTLNIENLNTGIYFYSIKRNGNTLETNKLVVQ